MRTLHNQMIYDVAILTEMDNQAGYAIIVWDNKGETAIKASGAPPKSGYTDLLRLAHRIWTKYSKGK